VGHEYRLGNCVEHLDVIAAETLSHRDGFGVELVAQS
jgi:hypothetical protein